MLLKICDILATVFVMIIAACSCALDSECWYIVFAVIVVASIGLYGTYKLATWLYERE